MPWTHVCAHWQECQHPSASAELPDIPDHPKGPLDVHDTSLSWSRQSLAPTKGQRSCERRMRNTVVASYSVKARQQYLASYSIDSSGTCLLIRMIALIKVSSYNCEIWADCLQVILNLLYGYMFSGWMYKQWHKGVEIALAPLWK